ncbi:MAG TPA: ChbG/HpnK family deacetylase, partial [Solirubrobacterales bacterium]|nr:ChbG/HpnK family deacetylase [Solirubrobacterales bacterium]
MEEPLAAVAGRLAERLGVPLRGQGIRYEGRFFGRGVDGRPDPDAVRAEALVAILRGLPTGITELGCHPGLGGEGSSYDEERRWEVETLCDPEVRRAVAEERIRLVSFAELAR